ncbi:MAG: hypothetical protein HRT35_10585 [Algicola sp.]|nr:hypothetical protein [Algicola sp.]
MESLTKRSTPANRATENDQNETGDQHIIGARALQFASARANHCHKLQAHYTALVDLHTADDEQTPKSF